MLKIGYGRKLKVIRYHLCIILLFLFNEWFINIVWKFYLDGDVDSSKDVKFVRANVHENKDDEEVFFIIDA